MVAFVSRQVVVLARDTPIIGLRLVVLARLQAVILG